MTLSARRDSSLLLDRFKAHPPGRRVLLAANPPRSVSPQDILSFRDHSYSLRFSDIGGMVHWADVGVILADAVVARTSSKPFQDARAAAWSQKGNSLRMLAHFLEAEISLSVAQEAWSLGTGDPKLAALLWEFRGSLYRDARRFALAEASMARARAVHEEIGDEIGLTRCLACEAIFAGKNRNPFRAARLAERAMKRVDPCSDPLLAVSIAHTLAWNLVDQGKPRRARAVYSATEPLFEELRDEDLVQAHRLWLVAHIDGALGLDESAESLLRRASEAYAAAGLFFEEALSRLDLAIVLARQQRLAEVVATVDEVQPLFVALGIAPEATAARLLRFEVMSSTVGQIVRTLTLAARELCKQPLPPRPIPAVAA
jgi:tetratricopeptide (TPR) repeat protein